MAGSSAFLFIFCTDYLFVEAVYTLKERQDSGGTPQKSSSKRVDHSLKGRGQHSVQLVGMPQHVK